MPVPRDELGSSAGGQQPQFRILRRPQGQQPSSSRTDSSTEASQRRQKTLEERKADYAQARLRILGSAYPEDEESENEKSQSEFSQIEKNRTTESSPPSSSAISLHNGRSDSPYASNGTNCSNSNGESSSHAASSPTNGHVPPSDSQISNDIPQQQQQQQQQCATNSNGVVS